jgi:hypothetical protein
MEGTNSGEGISGLTLISGPSSITNAVRLISSAASSDVVKLNIGGRKYITTKATLFRYGKNYFTSLLGGDYPAILDEEGTYFC